jgi:hypothetical protein
MKTRLAASSAVLGLALSSAALTAACGGDGSVSSTPSEGAGGSSGKGGSGGGTAGKGGASGSKGGSSGAAGAHAGSSGAAGSHGGAGGSSGASGASGSSGNAGHAGTSAGGGNAGGASGSSGKSGGGGTAAGGTGGNGVGGSSGTQGVGGGGGSGNTGGSSATGGSSGSGPAVLDVEPTPLQTITVPIGGTTPTVSYAATYGGQAVTVGWSDDSGNIGTVAEGPAATTLFTPSGTTGGLVDVIAGYQGMTVKRQVFVKLSGGQNGPTNNPAEMTQQPTMMSQLTAGGGVGGVGGEGLGTAVMDGPTLTALMSPSSDGSALGLKFLYPYDKTVWPRGMLAPLVMWNWTGSATAVAIHLETTSGSFSWTGTFGRPPLLPANAPFVRHPIPQDIWEEATNTAGGPTPDGTPDQLKISVTLADATGAGYGPINETWNVAPGRLTGIIYYNSYGTQLAHNYGGAVGGNHQFGGAVLSIHVGDTGPALAAGDDNNCRVCHSVAAGGSRLIVQHGDSYGTSSAYDLTPSGNTETVMAVGAEFPGLSADGSIALSPDGTILPLPMDNAPVNPTGIAATTTNLGTPAFSPDGHHAAMSPAAGPIADPTQKLVVMDFDGTSTFSNPVVVVDDTGQPADTRPGWPAFFPDGNSIVFQHQSAPGLDGNGAQLETRKGAMSQIAWTNITDATHVTPLNALNGFEADGMTPYLPSLPGAPNANCTADGSQVGNMDPSHSMDTDYNYEATVNPIATGGYAWVVFTSRRMYGNEATIPPYCSDPRGVDLIQNITTKKLWVAAIDLNAAPGTDASHPAFYLPAQELLAGNARGFWVLDPCKADGSSCESGDQCCNGYCEPNGSGGALICSSTPPNNQCSGTQEKCASVADCCDQTESCVNGFCVQSKP